MVDIEKTGELRRRSTDYVGPGVGLTAVPRRGVSWGSIFAGAVLASIISLVLNMLGVGIGAVSVSPQGGNLQGLGIGTGIWVVVASLFALFVGGWAAARLSSSATRGEGVLHGLITWGFVTIFAVYLIGNAMSSIIGGATGLVSQVAPQASQQVQPGDRARAEQQLERARQQAPQAGEQAADVAGGTSIVAAIAMLLGGLAAGLGGALAAKRNRERLYGVTTHHPSATA